ncbi:MAG: WXG100 family type VII secretion target, partial [Lachnospiraceae bacterium]|nr:WXG100 family type VII secretion target [Lachnospiraceae bacterium]
RTKAAELRDLNGRLKMSTGNLESREGQLASMWEGESKEAFHIQFISDKGQLDNMYTAIENFIISLENIASRYEQAEAASVELANTRTYK